MNNISETLELLEDIDCSINSAEIDVLEQMNREYDKLYKMSCIQEYYIQESVSSKIKTGIGYVIQAIKKLIQLIIQGIKRFISFIARLIKGRKKTRDVNNILDDMGVKQVNEYYTESSKPNNKMKVFYTDIDGNVIKYKINSNKRNDFVKFFKNISYMDKITKDEYRVAYGGSVILLIQYPEILDAMIDIVKCIHIENGKVTAEEKISGLFNKYIEEISTKGMELSKDFEHNLEHSLNTKNIRQLNVKVLAMQKYIDKVYHMPTDSPKMNLNNAEGINQTEMIQSGNVRFYIDAINDILVCINGGINILTQDMTSIYSIDEKYYNSITTEDHLDQFISLMLHNGYQSSNIFTNIKYVIGGELSGNIEHGMTRAVIINKDHKFVLKCAINSSGLSANKMESKIYDLFQKVNQEEFLAKVIDTYKNECVLKQEFCKDIGRISYSEMESVYENLDKICDKHDFVFIADRKVDAIGRRVSDNKFVVTDYGIASKFTAKDA